MMSSPFKNPNVAKQNLHLEYDLVTYSVISHERGKNREVFATNGTYPWSFVTKIFLNGQPSHGGDRKTFDDEKVL
jgi:hypothetical protein